MGYYTGVLAFRAAQRSGLIGTSRDWADLPDEERARWAHVEAENHWIGNEGR